MTDDRDRLAKIAHIYDPAPESKWDKQRYQAIAAAVAEAVRAEYEERVRALEDRIETLEASRAKWKTFARGW